jgi:hypothetical protein
MIYLLFLFLKAACFGIRRTLSALRAFLGELAFLRPGLCWS